MTTAERDFSVGDQVIHTSGGTMVTVIGEIIKIDGDGYLTVETQFCSNKYGIRNSNSELVEEKIHRNAANLVNLSKIVSTANQKDYLPDR